MKPSLEKILDFSENLDKELVERHLRYLDDAYFERFNIAQICGHLETLSALSRENPVEVLLTHTYGKEQSVECTIVSYDYSGVFSIITGILAAMGFNIISGEIFTYKNIKPEASGKKLRRRMAPKKIQKEAARERRQIIDHFSGKINSRLQGDLWFEQFREKLKAVIILLEKADETSIKLARAQVNEMVTRYLMGIDASGYSMLYPVQIEIENNNETGTKLKVVSQDTPAFLYAMSSSLALQGISIEYVRIRTILGRIEDIIIVNDKNGNHIEDPKALDKLKLTVLMTKQFTYFLDKAPDPYSALSRFEQIVADTVELPDSGNWLNMLSDPHSMDKLAKVLGASDFLWEDFIRLQYEALMPILKPHVSEKSIAGPAENIPDRLAELLSKASSYEEKKTFLNDFKNRESFLIDLNHILDPESNFRTLSESLSCLAEAIVRASSDIVYEDMVAKYGKPLSVAGMEASYAIFGLGKMGGAALGYASDIELLYIYSDNGRTDGAQSINNTEFFSNMVLEVSKFIVAKKEGIFKIDLRLRPYGESGPLGVSLENFCRYYGPGGTAHSYERLALVRLRAIGGDEELGKQVERLRDEFVYSLSLIDMQAVRKLRKVQFREKDIPGQYNAKFSQGALVDIEYSVQLLQVISRGKNARLMTPRIHSALEALRDSGILTAEEQEQLNAAYDFFRNLINALRMLRGSAKDLCLPGVDSDEFMHLARRMGFTQKGDLSAAQQLMVEFETHTALVRSFVERHLGRDSLPAPEIGNVVDIIINDNLPEEIYRPILKNAGFENADRAFTNLKGLAGTDRRRELFVKLAVLACDILRHEPDPDMALNNWERFTQSLPDIQSHFNLLFSQPRRLGILIGIFSRSQFLADTLIKNPVFFEWVTSPDNLYKKHSCDDLKDELRSIASEFSSDSDWLCSMNRFRKREMLRIGTCDMCLKFPFRDLTLDLANLAGSIIDIALEKIWKGMIRENPECEEAAQCFSVLAFGKLGGSELNYSSDIDLLGIYDEDKFKKAEISGKIKASEIFYPVMEKLRDELSRHTEEGYSYRVDLRLRPYGRSGPLVSSLRSIVSYYASTAALWEIQAALKLRPVAGNIETGNKLMLALGDILSRERSREEVFTSIRNLREISVRKQSSGRNASSTDIKSGIGGIREVEFLVQGLQMINAHKYPSLINGNTLNSLELLHENKILSREKAKQLSEDYIFLRVIEHYLQILEDQQLHSLPVNPKELSALAKRVLGIKEDFNSFSVKLNECLCRVHNLYSEYIEKD